MRAEKPALVFLAYPNNPTGGYLTAKEIADLRTRLRPDVLLVIDAAYAEYVVRNDYTPGTELVDEGVNTVMTRTFSKIYALAALRIGWAYCPPPIYDVLERLRAPFNISTAAGLVAAACGVPVAAYPVTGPRDVLGSAPVGCLDADLAQAVRGALLMDPSACRAFAGQRTWRQSAEQFLGNLVTLDRWQSLIPLVAA